MIEDEGTQGARRQARSETGAGRGAGDDADRRMETMTLEVPSHPKYLYVIRSAVYPVVLDAGFSKKDARRVVLALDEACSNIIKYAYAGDPSHIIQVRLTVEQDRLLVQLTDTGKKPDVAAIASRKLDDIRPGGLGTHFMASVFDSLAYDTGGAQGTVLTMIKKRR